MRTHGRERYTRKATKSPLLSKHARAHLISVLPLRGIVFRYPAAVAPCPAGLYPDWLQEERGDQLITRWGHDRHAFPNATCCVAERA